MLLDCLNIKGREPCYDDEGCLESGTREAWDRENCNCQIFLVRETSVETETYALTQYDRFAG